MRLSPVGASLGRLSGRFSFRRLSGETPWGGSLGRLSGETLWETRWGDSLGSLPSPNKAPITSTEGAGECRWGDYLWSACTPGLQEIITYASTFLSEIYLSASWGLGLSLSLSERFREPTRSDRVSLARLKSDPESSTLRARPCQRSGGSRSVA